MKVIWFGILIAVIAVSFYVSTDAGIAAVCAVAISALWRWWQERPATRPSNDMEG